MGCATSSENEPNSTAEQDVDHPVTNIDMIMFADVARIPDLPASSRQAQSSAPLQLQLSISNPLGVTEGVSPSHTGSPLLTPRLSQANLARHLRMSRSSSMALTQSSKTNSFARSPQAGDAGGAAAGADDQLPALQDNDDDQVVAWLRDVGEPNGSVAAGSTSFGRWLSDSAPMLKSASNDPPRTEAPPAA